MQQSQAKPKFRGWIHAGFLPVVFAAGIVLILLAPTPLAKLCAGILTLVATALFGVSATYHVGSWSERVHRVLKRLDHANIFLVIAGTYTPFAVYLLSGRPRAILLCVVWIGALIGIIFRSVWLSAPRWLYTPVYVLVGWSSIFFIGDFWRAGGTAVLILILVGGGLYSIGAVVYALKRPNPAPNFGFHEVFHSLTIAAYICHYVAASLVLYSAEF